MELISDYVRISASAGLYLLAIFGWGNLLAHSLFRGQKEGFWDYFLSRIVMGCAVLYAAFIILATGGLLLRIPVGIFLALGIIGSFAAGSELGRRIQKQVANIRSWDPIERGMATCIGILCLLQLACGLAPLIFYDLQVYQLVAPSQFLKSGSLVQVPWNVLSNSPMALQLTLGMSLVMDSDGAVTKLLLAVFGCLLAGAVAQLLEGRKAALLAAVFVLCFPEFWAHQTLGVVDLAIAGFLILGIAWARRTLVGGNWRWAVLAGCAFGFVVGSRYQAIVLTVWFTALLLLEHVRTIQRVPRRVLVRFAAIPGIATLFVIPWLIRNAANFGNPVFPLLPDIWGSPGWSAAQAARLSQEVFGPQLSTLPITHWVTAPLSALVMMPGNGLFGIGLILGVVMAVCLSHERDVRMAAIMGMTGLTVWSILQPTPVIHLMRYNAVSIALLLTATAAVLANYFPGQKGIRVGLVIAGGSLLIALPFVQSIVPVWQTLLSSSYRASIWQANVPGWQAFAAVNSTLDPTRHKILVVGETRGFWLRIPFLAPTAFDAPRLSEIFREADAAVWRKKLDDLGITHLLISYPEWDRLRDRYDYLRLSPEEISRLTVWFQSLPVVFDDTRGTLVLATRTAEDR